MSTHLVDEIDIKIIDALSKDSSITFLKLSKQIGVSDATVHQRVKRLREAGIIGKFTITVDNSRLGYGYLGYVGINLKGVFTETIIHDLSSIDEVLEVHEIHNTFDLFIKLRAKSIDDLRNIVENKILQLPYEMKTELMPVLRTGKEEYNISTFALS